MSRAAVAERYARAVFALGLETGQLDAMAQQVADMAAVYVSSADLRSVLDNPLVAEEKREAVLRAIAARLQLGPLVQNLLRLLAQRHRMAALPDLARALRVMTDEKTGVLRATVTSATVLTDLEVRQIAQQLERQTKRRVVIEKAHEPALIAGLVTRIGGKTIDGSLKGRLEALERRLLSS